jgi:YD repeat-containing protein
MSGDVIAIIDTDGNTVAKYKYDSYGNCTRGASSNYDLADSNSIKRKSWWTT